MKRMLLGLLMMVVTCCGVTAAEDNSWSPFQVGFFPNFPDATVHTPVYGIKSGWPMCGGVSAVYGVEVSWLYSGTAIIRGVQASWIYNHNVDCNGLQGSWIINYNRDMFYGLQASALVNIMGSGTGFQGGGFNYSDNFTGVQAGLLGNFNAGNFRGFQTGMYNVSDVVNGFQLSGVNVAKELNGFQFGFVNVAEKRGFQMGLVNIIKGGCIPFMPLMNFSF
ncbi:MAG: hypothetical protein RRY34_05545 [Victivallaceae bacterium]